MILQHRGMENTIRIGVKCQKWVDDVWNYQEILFNLRPSFVIEFGMFSRRFGSIFQQRHEAD
jgi:cephalosporin hydroxylase